MSAMVNGYFSKPEEAIGMEVTRPLRLGTTLNQTMVRAPNIIRRGQQVVLFAQAQGFEIRMEGQALMDGASGQVIRVRNNRSRRIIEGKVAAGGRVEINL